MREADLNFDFIVVGGGSAGCVLASRLSADPANRVLLLEAGNSGRDPSYDLPFIAGKLFEFERNNWAFRSQPQKNLNGRSMYFPRGKMLGGSFIFNGAQYIRGNRSDFDHWRQLGNAGWSYDDVLPYFTKSESYEGGESAYHNDCGGLPVGKPPTVSPLTAPYLEACRQAGYRLNDDFNGPEQEGFGIYDFNIRGGRRVTTAKAFLRPAMKRPNLRVIVNALVSRIVIDEARASGVEFFENGGIRRASATREIVLSAGSFNSPKLLMLSGLGDAEDLQSHGIAVVNDLRGVGKNLQDHVNASVAYEATQPVSLARTLRWHTLTAEMINALVFRRGQITRSPLEAGGFFNIKKDAVAPECQAVFIPYYPGQGLKVWMPWADRMAGHSFVVHVWPNRPESRGMLTLKSSDPREAPIFDPHFLTSENDLALTRDAIRATRRILQQEALAPYRGTELAPGADIRSDEELDSYIRTTCGIGHHTCGTAKMGHDAMAVVDDQLKVHGVDGLRVADASIMPTMVSGNTNAATIMIAEKAASMLLRGN
ncbi:choline dehydrogenase [bacterium M00.F.Ca.ET.141.01.1.1]|uniref:GMC family oxidoreductase n=1 Tax=unclassified Mesorhizobium TaxID=325217 RepID=UPI000FDC0251|nr:MULTISPECIES: GMC family oxidoreductase N-terminal domain-containing protein [unclassified Mesorhizobium]TGR43673.1 choline dehydrogenase [bacterium M00.F.Ca.ET.199.01.1.1]TGU40285.1 choline dehydrogenase [bacterium M00.F.Ca.ET.156.01.1.1]TGV54089.1 choline dehydrogenase [bacterium M00.F.Ca.ET.141.01.1.1]TGV86826.1 choline dehydrogenase [Mesorhizobium sp. M00.F.Ca.ET.149.01.1.1]TGR28006.1 choline dehydrogenase [Mesorhizobium sp. M8A.F.Ca.ET.197.01.1.1]